MCTPNLQLNLLWGAQKSLMIPRDWNMFLLQQPEIKPRPDLLCCDETQLVAFVLIDYFILSCSYWDLSRHLTKNLFMVFSSGQNIRRSSKPPLFRLCLSAQFLHSISNTSRMINSRTPHTWTASWHRAQCTQNNKGLSTSTRTDIIRENRIQLGFRSSHIQNLYD